MKLVSWDILKADIERRSGRKMSEYEENKTWWNYIRVSVLRLDPLPLQQKRVK